MCVEPPGRAGGTSLTSRTTTSTTSPAFSASLVDTLRSCEISERGMSPSTPPRSTKAPKSRTPVTVPRTTTPTPSVRSVSPTLSLASRWRAARRDTTTPFPPSRTSVIMNENDWPTSVDGSSTNFAPTCDIGQKALAPPISTSSPPLFTPVTFPMTGMSLAFASSSPATFVARPIDLPTRT